MNLITRVIIFVYALVMRGEHTGFPRYQKAQSSPRPEIQQYNTTSRAYLTRHVVTTEIHHGLTAQLIEPPRQEIDIFKMHTYCSRRRFVRGDVPRPGAPAGPSVRRSLTTTYVSVRERHVQHVRLSYQSGFRLDMFHDQDYCSTDTYSRIRVS